MGNTYWLPRNNSTVRAIEAESHAVRSSHWCFRQPSQDGTCKSRRPAASSAPHPNLARQPATSLPRTRRQKNPTKSRCCDDLGCDSRGSAPPPAIARGPLSSSAAGLMSPVAQHVSLPCRRQQCTPGRGASRRRHRATTGKIHFPFSNGAGFPVRGQQPWGSDLFGRRVGHGDGLGTRRPRKPGIPIAASRARTSQPYAWLRKPPSCSS